MDWLLAARDDDVLGLQQRVAALQKAQQAKILKSHLTNTLTVKDGHRAIFSELLPLAPNSGLFRIFAIRALQHSKRRYLKFLQVSSQPNVT